MHGRLLTKRLKPARQRKTRGAAKGAGGFPKVRATGESTAATHGKEEKRALAAIVESSTDALISRNLKGTITSWNQGAERLFGYTAREAVGQHISMLVPPDRDKEETEIFKRISSGDRIDHFQTVRRHKEGSLVEISLSVSPIKDASGQIIGASKIAHDISEPRRVERQLLRQAQQQQQLYRLADTLNHSTGPETVIYEAALEAILICLETRRASILLMDDDGVMRFKASRGLSADYQRAVEGHSPWTRDTLDPQPICVENVANAPMEEELRRAIQQEGIGAMAFIPLTYQKRLLGKFMVYRERPHRFSESEVQLAQTIANQLAFGLERKRGEQALRDVKDRLANQAVELERLVSARTVELIESNKQLETFLYTVAHDLRAPLRAMEGFSTMLLEEAGSALGETGKDLGDRISKSARFMSAMLTDLLTFSRISQQRIELKPIRLKDIVQSVLMRLKREIQEREAHVEEDAAAWPRVLGHESILMEILMILVGNALKFVAPGVAPKVRLRAEERSQFVRVWVEDNGVGIAPEHHAQIFRLFVRLEGEVYPGTGTGLAIVQKGIERMGGRVGVDSARDRGSRFWFELKKGRNSDAL